MNSIKSNFAVFDSLCSSSLTELKENNFHLLRLKQLIDKNPQQTFNQLFFDYYQQTDQLELSIIIKRLKLIVDQITLPLLNYLIHLEKPYTSALNNFNEQKELCLFIQKLRSRLKELLEEKSQTEIEKRLKHITQFDTYAERRLEVADRGFNDKEVIKKITEYLYKARPLADLAYFDNLYFSTKELNPIKNQLNQNSFNDFTQQFIKDRLLTIDKKDEILSYLQNFIIQSSLAQQSKQAYAVYLTLGTSIPWSKHPFIKRLVINSYFESIIN